MYIVFKDLNESMMTMIKKKIKNLDKGMEII